MKRHTWICLTLLLTLVLAACAPGATEQPTIQPTPTRAVEQEETPVAIVAEESAPEDTTELAEFEFNEAPMLAELVASGDLPPVEERLPELEDTSVIEPVDGIGEYGGTWYNASWGPDVSNIKMILYDPPIRWKPDYTGYEPGLLRSWEVSDDGTQITWHFRRGVKWSDGVEFTTDTLRFWWEDLATNPDYKVISVPP